MLGMMRKISNKTVTKVLLGGLVLVFISFGFGNFRSSKDNVVSINGKPAVSLEELAKQKRIVVQSISQYYPNLDTNSVDINQLALDQLVRNKLIDLEVKDLGLTVSDNLVLDLIKKNRLFYNDKGEFDKSLFKKVLSSNHITESDYINGLKLSIAVSSFSKNMTNFTIPDYIVEQFYLYDNQERTVELLIVDRAAATKALVSDKEIENFYEANKNQFYAPEFREIEYIAISSNKGGKGSDFQNMQNVEKAIDEGKSLKEIADKYKLSYVKLPKIDVQGLSSSGQKNKMVPEDTKFLSEAFSLSEGVVSEAIKIGNKYYVINASKIEPKHLRSLDQVKFGIISELQNQKSRTENGKIASDIRQEIAKNALSVKYSNQVKTKLVTLKRPKSAVAVDSIPVSNIVNIFLLENLGEYTEVFQLNNGSFAFAKLKSINKPSGNPGKDMYNNLPQIFSGIINQDFMSYLYKKYKVEIHNQNIGN